MYCGEHESKRVNNYNRRREIARTIKMHPEKTYEEIADEFNMTKGNVQRIAAAFDVQRNPRKY